MTPDDPNDLINQGERLSEQSNYQAALGCYIQAAQLAASRGQARTELNALDSIAVCWSNLGELNRFVEAATRLLERARRLEDQKYQMVAGLRLGDAMAKLDVRTRWPEICPVLLEGLQTARQLGDDFFIVYHLCQLGEVALGAGEIKTSHTWLQDALNALTPTTYKAAYFRYRIYESLGEWARQRGDEDETLRYAELSLGAAREHGRPTMLIEAQTHLADVHRRRGARAEALALVEEALAAARRLNHEMLVVDSLTRQARLLAELGLAERARAAYDELWTTEWANADRYRTIGWAAYETMNDPAGAERAFRLFLAGRPTHPEGHHGLALALFEQGRAEEAARAWRVALTHRNEYPAALTGLAVALWAEGRRDEALTVFGQAAELEPRVADAGYLDWSRKAAAAVSEVARGFSLRLPNDSGHGERS